jgi:ABC-type nitrate/sulfonate/bicarbonate transport system substrate-binding protein
MMTSSGRVRRDRSLRRRALPLFAAAIALASPAAADLTQSGSTTPVDAGWVELGDPSIQYVSRFGLLQ